MATTVVELTGLKEFIKAFNIQTSQLMPAVGSAIYNEAVVIADEADMLVPYDFGTLARSQIVHAAAIQGAQVYVDITYGGPARAYAEVQHENEDFSHPSLASGLPPNGRQAKYLSDPLDDAVKEDRLSTQLSMRIQSILLNQMGK